MYVVKGSSVIGGFYHYGNLLLRQCHRPRLFRCVAGHAGRQRFDMDCLSRRKDLRAPYALDRGGVSLGNRDCRRAAARALRGATTLGSQARNPLHTIPCAVIQSAVLAGAFFTVCAYAEVLVFHGAGQDLDTSQAPMYVLARVGGVPVLGLPMAGRFPA